MRRLRFALAVMLIVGAAAVVAGCGESDPEAAQTPPDAVTITNGQPPIEDGGEAEGSGGEGDSGAGQPLFESACQGCHPAAGAEAGTGPILANKALVADAIRQQIVNGGNGMPANLVSGADLDNVVAFVVSLQGEAAEGGGGGDDAVTAGQAFFEGSCQGCHPAGGTAAGAGPVLTGKGLAEDAIRNQIANGGGAMPGGLASGDDLENVTKFVVSLQ